MDTTFAILRVTRGNVLRLTADLSAEQLLAIPDGHANNLLWQLGHLWVTLEILAYKMSGLPLPTASAELENFRKGTSPQDWDKTPAVEAVRAGLLGSIDRVVADYKAGAFTTYERYETSFGFTLASIEDALQFNNVHEGVHFGAMLALKKHLLHKS